MLTIGLTGGFCGGKSTVAGMFKKLGAKIVDADVVARRIIKSSAKIGKRIIKHFGRTICGQNSEISRKKLAAVVFADTAERKVLNQLTHPEIIKQLKNIITAEKKKRTAVLVVEAPLLYEAGIAGIFDRVIVVKTSKKNQLARAVLKKKMTAKEALRRSGSQLPLKEKIAKCDFVVNNNDSVSETQKEVEKIWKKLLTKEAK